MLKNAQKDFIQRHIGPSADEQNVMLKELGYKSLDELIKDTVPEKILSKDQLDIGDPNSEYKALRKLKVISQKNKVYSSFIGNGILWNLYALCNIKKHFRKSRMVYIIHTLSTRSSTRKIGNVNEFSTDDN